ncbi:hypothetical protein NDU88_007184 [Pleurodeles waltl]|uniref:Uncharacterized protein n=1 Tax=Pleurodeles waltl TaxID=8319 RepID=A0AAV7VRW5_PLEWA|nr:hypothetical protein NDU88_007184 [Pleurodeles waltl]
MWAHYRKRVLCWGPPVSSTSAGLVQSLETLLLFQLSISSPETPAMFPSHCAPHGLHGGPTNPCLPQVLHQTWASCCVGPRTNLTPSSAVLRSPSGSYAQARAQLGKAAALVMQWTGQASPSTKHLQANGSCSGSCKGCVVFLFCSLLRSSSWSLHRPPESGRSCLTRPKQGTRGRAQHHPGPGRMTMIGLLATDHRRKGRRTNPPLPMSAAVLRGRLPPSPAVAAEPQ